MSYCINPNCPKRQNDIDLTRCQTCGTPLYLQNRYQLTRPLRDFQSSPYIDIFEAQDKLNPDRQKVIKILKVTEVKLGQLFEREAQVLKSLDYPGIPKVEPDGYFLVTTIAGNSLPCLVMEKIAGQDLQDWLQKYQLTSLQQTLSWLTQLINILGQLHSQKLFHRDIKPSNIVLQPNGNLSLIDFGSVRAISETIYREDDITLVLTPGYAPPEQWQSQAVPQSDFYALGRTFAHLLTGKHPIDLENSVGKLDWRDLLPADFPILLADLIDKLMSPSVSDRPTNIREIRQSLQEIELQLSYDPNRQSQQLRVMLRLPFRLKQLRRIWLIRLMLTILTALITGTGFFKTNSQLSSSNITISKEEQTIFPAFLQLSPNLTIRRTVAKRQGMKLYRQGNYAAAISQFKASLQQEPLDPETRIFLNNAKIGSRKSYTLVVAIPHDFNNTPAMLAALRSLNGIQQAQAQIDRQGGINGVRLKLLITSDTAPNSIDRAATTLVRKTEVLGIIDASIDNPTTKAARIYCGRMPVIAVASYSKGNSLCRQSLFNLIPSGQEIAKVMAKHIPIEQHRRKVVIFYNSLDGWSERMKFKFQQETVARGGKIIHEFDFAAPEFDPRRAMNKALKDRTAVVALFPNLALLKQEKFLALFKVNQNRLALLGGPQLSNAQLLEVARDNGGTGFENMAIVTPCCGGRAEEGNWQRQSGNDAVRYFATALKDKPTRAGIQAAFANPNFSITSSSSKIRFSHQSQRSDIPQIVKVVKRKEARLGYSFVPIK
jgi:eukaryotic-like serine/threonine-protein kinase